ncbi:MAG TPA: glycine zipper domain-containing protein [Burkholderiales bacterium]|nr:glycine zipper domain-containing protein [Burkholderiales bacterium]
MHRSLLAVLALAVSVGIAGCANQSRAEKVGTVGGAAAGAAIGNAAGGGTLGTVGGAAAGGYLGNKAGEAYDKRHRD